MTKSRITAQTKEIADAHIKALESGVFKDTEIKDKAELLEAMRQGYTFYEVLHQIEIRYASTTSIMINRMGLSRHVTEAYKKAIYKGFKELLQSK
jgi:hypothetical protein